MIKIESAFHLSKKKKGLRYLVDRLWPRGVHRRDMEIDGWLRELAPSEELAEWFHSHREKLDEFRRRYFRELNQEKSVWEPLAESRDNITLVYDANHPKYNHAALLRDYLNVKRKTTKFTLHPHIKRSKAEWRGISPPLGKSLSKKRRTAEILPRLKAGFQMNFNPQEGLVKAKYARK